MPPIGKAGPVSHISQAYPDRVEVRGRDLCGDLMGRVSFTEYFHLLLTGREPTEEQRYFLDLLLVAIAEHGLMPSNVAARMTLAADPDRCRGRSRPGSSAAARSSSARPSPARGCSKRRRRRSPQAASRRRSPRRRARDHAARRQGAGVRPSRSPAARPARRADPRARGRARRERAARRCSRACCARRSPRPGASR